MGDSWNERGSCRFSRHGGATYLAIETLPTIINIDEKNWKLVPVRVCGLVRNAPQFLKEWAGTNNCHQAGYQWNDANGDGLPQQAEVTFYGGGNANM